MDNNIKQMLEWYKEIGVDEVISDAPVNNFTYNPSIEPMLKKSTSREIADNAQNIEELFSAIQEFNGCALKENATNTVVGEGNTEAEILLIGEAPGAQEDKEARPFCGDSGKLLDLMLGSIGLSRHKNVFITNNIFWRPPANRRPSTEELSICLPFLERMISLINPKLIIMVGSVAASNLTGFNYNMSRFREDRIEYNNIYLSNPIKTITIFHPAYLLRQPYQKKVAWFDLLKVEDFIKSNNIKT